jgi:hypothetical protein
VQVSKEGISRIKAANPLGDLVTAVARQEHGLYFWRQAS